MTLREIIDKLESIEADLPKRLQELPCEVDIWVDDTQLKAGMYTYPRGSPDIVEYLQITQP